MPLKGDVMNERVFPSYTGILTVYDKNGDNKVILPDPQGITWGIQDLDSEDGSGRNASGLMQRDRVAIKIKLTINWGVAETATLQKILNSPIKNQFFKCKYLDPKEGDFVTKTMYVGDRSSPMLLKRVINGKTIWLWNGLSADFIER